MTNMKEKVKRQIGFMKLGAKRLPHVIAQKGKEYAKKKIVEGRETAEWHRGVTKKAQQARREAYEKQLVEQAKVEGRAIAARRAKTTGQGAGWRETIHAASQRMNVSDLLGFPQPAPPKKPKKKQK